MPSRQRHNYHRSSGRSRRTSSDAVIAANHKLRSRSQSISYKEPEENEDGDFVDTASGDDKENEYGKSTQDGVSSNTDEDVPLAKRVKLRLPKRRLVQKDEDEDEDAYVEMNDDDEEDEIIQPRTRTRPTRLAAKEDDEYIASEDNEEGSLSAEYSDGSDYERLRRQDEDRSFVVSDEEGSRSKRRKRRAGRGNQRSSSSRRRRRGRLALASRHVSDSDESYKEDGDADELDDRNSLQEELEDLKTTPEASPPRKNLRERKKNINYQIPPPLPDNMTFDEAVVPTGTEYKAAAVRKIPKLTGGFNKGLFPVAGPFGGNDIIPILGTNLIRDGGVLNGPPGAAAAGSGVTVNDSSSSDDDFVTRPYDVVSGTTAAASVSKKIGKKKKNAMADSDPLGIDTNIDFRAVGGLDNYIDQLKEMVALPLLYPEVYAKFGITPPRGVLFHGPPGTGKTLMARALASSCSSKERQITFFMRKGADCLSKWVGEAERQLRLLFEEAKNKQPSIIFFDEIDGLAPVRSSKQEQIHSSIVSTLLALMDGMDNRGQVIVIGATNRPDAIDPALRRPGRFDREFYFALPDMAARKTILNIHTSKWQPKPTPRLIDTLASLTKGYGGSDIRALCTEAALNSIKRRYPQIYDSDRKLVINPDDIKVSENDFMNALDKIVPSSARSTSSPSSPIPDHLRPLLDQNYFKIVKKVDQLVSRVKGKATGTSAVMDSDSESDDQPSFEAVFGMSKHQLLNKFNRTRVFQPRLLVSGRPGMGHKYLGAAVLNHLEGFQVQSLDIGTLFAESGRTAEATIIQLFLEARKNQPSILFIPTLEIWLRSVPESAKATLEGLLRTLNSSEQVLLLGLCEIDDENQTSDDITFLKYELNRFFGVGSLNNCTIELPDSKQREEFFNFLWVFLQTKPIFQQLNIDDPKYKKFQEIKHWKKMVKLPVMEINENSINETEKLANAELQHRRKLKQQKQQYKTDVRLKNLIKIKLSTIMEIFKTRYKRFKKPIIPLQQLAHLFEPSLYNPEEPPQYIKDGDMILDTFTGKRFFNMELDTIEERLWNGFYSEPKQFLKDVELIYLDAKTSDDRERSLKASELFVNAQVSIEELFLPDLLEQCKNLRKREIEKQKEYEAKVQEIENKMKENTVSTSIDGIEASNQTTSVENSIPANAEQPETSSLITKTSNENKLVENTNHMESSFLPDEDIKKDSPLFDMDSPKSNENKNGQADLKENDKKTDEAEKQDEKTTTQEPEKTFTKEELADYECYLEELKRNKTRELELDQEYLEKVKDYLISQSKGFTIENLELVNSLISEVIWQNKNEWNRNKVLKSIEKQLNKAFKIISRQKQ